MKKSEGKITRSNSENTDINETPNALWDFAKMKGTRVRVPLEFNHNLKYKIEGINTQVSGYLCH